MENEPFKIGDVVQLKSGGPKMTVTHVREAPSRGGHVCGCVWFGKNGKFESSVGLPASALKSVGVDEQG